MSKKIFYLLKRAMLIVFLPKPLKKRVIGAGVLGLALIVGLFYLFLRWNHVTENDAQVKADMITISSRLDGWIAERPVTDGDRVAEGDELVIIDQREATLQRDELRAKFNSLRLQSEQLKTQLDITLGSTESNVAAAKADYDAAEANQHAIGAELERNKLDFMRNKQLVEKDVISRQAWDESRTATKQVTENLRQAQAKAAAAKANLDAAISKLGDAEVLKKQIEQLDADMEQVSAQIQQKELEIRDRVLRSPLNGVIDQKFIEPGEYVIPGQRLLLLHDPKAIWIEANLKETKITRLRLGQPVHISVDAYPGRDFSGKIERIGTAATNQFALLPSPNPSGNFTKIAQRVPVRIRVTQPKDNPLRPGMMVEVDIDTSSN